MQYLVRKLINLPPYETELQHSDQVKDVNKDITQQNLNTYI